MVRATRGVSIGQLAAAAGIDLETVRYYERIALMPPPPRTEGGHRCYDQAHVRRLAFIRHARNLGFGIEDIRALLSLTEPGQRSCAEVQQIGSAHLAEVRLKLAHLTRLESLLSDTLDRCSGEATPACPVLDMLDGCPAS